MPHSAASDLGLNCLLWPRCPNTLGYYSINIQGPVVQSILSLMSLLMTNLLTAVAKVFSNTLIFLLHIFFSKNIIFAIFRGRNFNVNLAGKFIKF